MTELAELFLMCCQNDMDFFTSSSMPRIFHLFRVFCLMVNETKDGSRVARGVGLTFNNNTAETNIGEFLGVAIP